MGCRRRVAAARRRAPGRSASGGGRKRLVDQLVAGCARDGAGGRGAPGRAPGVAPEALDEREEVLVALEENRVLVAPPRPAVGRADDPHELDLEPFTQRDGVGTAVAPPWGATDMSSKAPCDE